MKKQVKIRKNKKRKMYKSYKFQIQLTCRVQIQHNFQEKKIAFSLSLKNTFNKKVENGSTWINIKKQGKWGRETAVIRNTVMKNKKL